MIVGLLEDSDSIREVLARYLELEGWEVQEFPRVAALDEWLGARAGAPGLDLMVLDVMLPDGDGFLVARRLRQRWPQLPFLFLSARAEESDRVTGLELGAEDYVTKPFSNREVVLRVKALLRRSTPPTLPAGHWRYGEAHLEWDESLHRVHRDGHALNLTAAEWDILVYLAQRAPQVLTRGQILQHCLASVAQGSERTVDTHVKNLRHKLGEGWIETVRGFGYRFAGQREPS